MMDRHDIEKDTTFELFRGKKIGRGESTLYGYVAVLKAFVTIVKGHPQKYIIFARMN
jgi:hypothetical protein